MRSSRHLVGVGSGAISFVKENLKTRTSSDPAVYLAQGGVLLSTALVRDGVSSGVHHHAGIPSCLLDPGCPAQLINRELLYIGYLFSCITSGSNRMFPNVLLLLLPLDSVFAFKVPSYIATVKVKLFLQQETSYLHLCIRSLSRVCCCLVLVQMYQSV